MKANLMAAAKFVRPWFLYIFIFLLLKYTGALSEISYFTNGALIKTGVLNASAKPDGEKKVFDYNFKIADLNNNIVDVSEFKGKTIFLNLWATWCGPCRVEMPSIQRLYDQVDHNKIVFIVLSIDQKDPYNKVNNFIKEKGFSFPVYLPAGPLPSQLNVSSIPTTFIIDPNGRISSKEVGATNFDTGKFKNYLESLGNH